MKTIIVTGVTGQVGYYVAKQALNEGMNVVGVVRYSTNFNDKFEDRQDLLSNSNFVVATGDLTDRASLDKVVGQHNPDYFVNCAAQSHVGESWTIPYSTAEITGLGVVNCLESIRCNVRSKPCKFVQCSTSEMFGKNQDGYINEDTPLCAMSPYGVSKIFAHEMVRVYRESYGMPCSCVIMFNNTSPKRDKNFFVRKITSKMGELFNRDINTIELGNLNFSRDWGFSGDYAKAIHMMLKSENREDFVVSTGINTKGCQLIHLAFDYANGQLRRAGKEPFFSFDKHISHDTKFDRPNDLTYLLGDNSKIFKHLGWTPEHNIHDIVRIMVDYDVFGVDE